MSKWVWTCSLLTIGFIGLIAIYLITAKRLQETDANLNRLQSLIALETEALQMNPINTTSAIFYQKDPSRATIYGQTLPPDHHQLYTSIFNDFSEIRKYHRAMLFWEGDSVQLDFALRRYINCYTKRRESILNQFRKFNQEREIVGHTSLEENISYLARNFHGESLFEIYEDSSPIIQDQILIIIREDLGRVGNLINRMIGNLF